MMVENVTKGKPAPSAMRESAAVEAALPSLRVRYFRQMKARRVSTVEVGWRNSDRPRTGAVTVRLFAPGAQVAPSEIGLDASKPDAKAVFYVTPLVKGWLRGEKLLVLSQGRKIQEMPLASKVVTQGLTWFFLYTAVAFLFLTVCSALFFMPKRRTVTSKPVALTGG